MCTFYRNHCSTICLLGQHARPILVPFLPSLSLFFLSSTNEAFPQMKQPIVWILARATKERVVERGKVALSF